MQTRDWLEVDYYAVLGVARTDTTETITERYRARAWELHPDRNPDDQDAEGAFKRIARAYAVLGNPDRRAAYDAARDRVFDRGFAPQPGSTRPQVQANGPGHLFRFSPRTGYIVGSALLVLGLAAVAWIVSVTRHDARVRAQGVAATARVVQSSPTAMVEFMTTSGQTVRATPPLVRNRRNGGYVEGARVNIRYLRSNPQELVIDESQTARNITMWIIAVKLLVCGAIVFGLSVFQRRPAR